MYKRFNSDVSSPGYDALKKLNTLRAKQSPRVRAQLQHQMKVADDSSPELQQKWFEMMKLVLQEVDEALKCVPAYCHFRFLDLGCCPRGFSSYILNKNPRAVGVGISLPVESGGHAFRLEEHLRPRLELKLADLTNYELGFGDDRLPPFPFPPGSPSFDLVLLDGHQLRTATSHNAWSRDCLLISQFIICLQSISKSGTVVVKLSKPEGHFTPRLLYMLDVLSLSLACWKPVYLHTTRATFYAVAKGVGLGRQGHRASELLYQLKMLWMELTYGGTGSGRKMVAGDLDFIISNADLQHAYQFRLGQLAQPIWMVQAASLQGWYQAEGLGRGS